MKKTGITFDKNDRLFTINTEHSTYQFKADEYGALLHLYYGGGITGSAEYLLQYLDRGFSCNPYTAGSDRTYSRDVLPAELPVWGNGDFRSPSLVIETGEGARGAEFAYVSHEITGGKYSLPGLPAVYDTDPESSGAQTLRVFLEDRVLGIELQLIYGVLPKLDVITRAAVITNRGSDTVFLDKAGSASIDFLTGELDLITFHGRHLLERNVRRAPIEEIAQIAGSRRGTSSHQQNPFIIVADRKASDDSGSCCAMGLVYSGGFQAEAEKDQFGTTRVQIGIQESGFRYPLEKGGSFTTPEAVLAYSDKGTDGLSLRLHDLIREHICHDPYKGRPRPVVLNSWESAYMDIDRSVLLELAGQAKELGIDMLVMDDGWFGSRNDDNTSLGDWNANEEKLGCTLGELIKSVNDLGVRFGIWMEPEMISEESRLYETHPDWALKLPGRKPVRGRNQLVLDLARREVREHVFKSICSVLDQGNIEYLKWDFNRSIFEAYSPKADYQGRVLHDYVLGLYEILERVTERYPDLLIEGCSGGGGRFDLGMLYYTPQIWTSDNTDAVDRLRIQYGTSFGYPPSCIAAHVSKCPNEQLGRITPMKTRGIAAMYGAFGFELDPALLTSEEKEEARRQVEDYRKYESLIREGDYYRLSDPGKACLCGWEFVSKDGSRALVHAVVITLHGNGPLIYVRVKGLKEGAMYRDEETGAVYSADILMKAGIPIPFEKGDYIAHRFHLILQEGQS